MYLCGKTTFGLKGLLYSILQKNVPFPFTVCLLAATTPGQDPDIYYTYCCNYLD